MPEEHEHGLVQVGGAVSVHGVPVPEDAIGFVPTGHRSIRISAGADPAVALLLGGEPLNEQIVMWWNFVGRSHEEIVEYRDRWQAERAGTAADSRFGPFPEQWRSTLPAPELPATRLRSRG